MDFASHYHYSQTGSKHCQKKENKIEEGTSLVSQPTEEGIFDVPALRFV